MDDKLNSLGDKLRFSNNLMVQNCLIFIDEIIECCLIQIIGKNNRILLVASLESHCLIHHTTDDVSLKFQSS